METDDIWIRKTTRKRDGAKYCTLENEIAFVVAIFSLRTKGALRTADFFHCL